RDRSECTGAVDGNSVTETEATGHAPHAAVITEVRAEPVDTKTAFGCPERPIVGVHTATSSKHITCHRICENCTGFRGLPTRPGICEHEQAGCATQSGSFRFLLRFGSCWWLFHRLWGHFRLRLRLRHWFLRGLRFRSFRFLNRHFGRLGRRLFGLRLTEGTYGGQGKSYGKRRGKNGVIDFHLE